MHISKNLKFVCEKSELSGVKKIAAKVCNDVKLVFGFEPALVEADVQESFSATEPALIFGTAASSPLLKKYLGEANVGKREVYTFTVEGEKIIIAGSDKRGVIYGLFHFSELLGVSPLVNWCNILPPKKKTFELPDSIYISPEPSVRFRGFFINDEWPAFGNWAIHNFGGVNAKMYENVFELLLRLKGNYLWPAMWASRFSDDGPGLENAELADELGVVMGASHHEPCCRAGEEYRYLRGPDSIYGDAWNFRSNEAGITKFWEDGLKRNGKFENVITVGMRGEADTAIMKNATLADNINLLRDVLKTQNRLIRENVNPDVMQVPRMLALYKEVEPYFYGDKHTKGLMGDPELEGVTLMLCDDNHGNLRTVPTEKMRDHKGGYGMYYHFDYHGWPYSYEWLNTNYLPKAKEQMCAAYDFGIRDLWIVNVGDIMTNEFPLSYFLNLAYDYEKYSKLEYTTQGYTAEWVEQQFPEFSHKQKASVNYIMNTYTKLANMRRTECLWPETFAPANFNESERILGLAESVLKECEKLKEELSKKDYPGFFAQVYFPACGTMNVLKMQLLVGRNKWCASHNMIAANVYADQVEACLNFDKKLVEECDKVDGGRWFAMGWSEHFGFVHWNEEENRYPVLSKVVEPRKGRLCAWVEGTDFVTTGGDWTRFPLRCDLFKNPAVENARIFVAACNKKMLPYEISIEGEKDWLNFTVKKDKTLFIDTINLTVDRSKLLLTDDKTAVLKITGDGGHGCRVRIDIKIDATVPNLNYDKGTFIQTSNYVSMEAAHFVKKESGVWENKPSDFYELVNYGKTLSAIKAFPVIADYPKGKNAPFVEYKFVLQKEGIMQFDFYMNPSNPAYKDNKLAFIAEVNGDKIKKDVVDAGNFAVGDNQMTWGNDITNNIRISNIYADCREGLNILRFYPVTPNIVLEKIVIHNANEPFPYSYLGAPESYCVK